MKITTAHIIKILEKEYGWYIDKDNEREMMLIRDVRNVIDAKLKWHKQITIK